MHGAEPAGEPARGRDGHFRRFQLYRQGERLEHEYIRVDAYETGWEELLIGMMSVRVTACDFVIFITLQRSFGVRFTR